MKSNQLLLITIISLLILGCEQQDNMDSNPLRAKAKEVEQQQEQAGRERETQYGSAISESFKKSSDK